MKELDINYSRLEEPDLPPWTVRAIIQARRGKFVSERMFSYYVKITTGKTTAPARGRGTTQLSSIKDTTLQLSGLDITDLGLGPAKVRVCVAAMRNGWNEIISGIKQREGASSDKFVGYPSPDKFLLGYMVQNKFVAIIVDYMNLPLWRADGPLFVYNCSRNLFSNLVFVYYFVVMFCHSIELFTQTKQENVDALINTLKQVYPEELQRIRSTEPSIQKSLKEFARYFTQYARK